MVFVTGVMTARQLVTSTGVVRVSGEGYAPVGTFLADDGEHTAADDPLLYYVLRAAAACNDAELGEQHGRPTVVGDPTEGALLVVAAKGGSRVRISRPRYLGWEHCLSTPSANG